MTPAACPDCHAQLSKAPGEGISWVCPSCGGRLLGLAPFEKLLPEGEGARMWVSSSDGEAAGPCPYCGRPMKKTSGGECFCRLCQEVWLPAGCDLPAPPAASSAPLPAECQNCGAPLDPDEMGRCRYCHAQVMAPRPIVVEMPAPVAHPTTGNRLLDGLVGLLTEPIE